MSSKARIGVPGRLPTDLRYEAQQSDGTWQIIDRMTDLPAASNGRDLVKLRRDDALEIADELNRCEAEGSRSPLL